MRTHDNYGLALAVVAGTVALVIAGLTAIGGEAKGISFSPGRSARPSTLGPAARAAE